MALGDGIRRNIATVTKEERDHFRDAIIALQKNYHYPGGRKDLAEGIAPAVGGVSYGSSKTRFMTAPMFTSVPHFSPGIVNWAIVSRRCCGS